MHIFIKTLNIYTYVHTVYMQSLDKYAHYNFPL